MGNGNGKSGEQRERFVFEDLDVYQLAVELYSDVLSVKLNRSHSDQAISRQLHRAVLSISLNIAEGSGKSGNRDKRNFLLIARGSPYECVAIFNALKIKSTIDTVQHQVFYSKSIRISKMLRSMINKLE